MTQELSDQLPRPAWQRSRVGLLTAILGLLFLGSSVASGVELDARRCESLGQSMVGRWPEKGTRVLSVQMRPAALFVAPHGAGAMAAAPMALPEHCEVLGILHERVGFEGQHYAIRFHVRLPTHWNERFFYQGGGGINGVVGDALGPIAPGVPVALIQGFAVVSQDTGHDNDMNSDPLRGGANAFGFDPQARADYGHASLRVVADAAKALVNQYYGHPPRYKYFVGCSKGGEEGMVFAQRHPDEFDGIVASAPGFSLPRAAVAEAWDVQSLAPLMTPSPGDHPIVSRMAGSFSDSDLRVASDVVLSACDADDGVKDGMVGAFQHCTGARVVPILESKRCKGGKEADCLSPDQILALTRIFAGPMGPGGKSLYSAWQWDAGLSAPGWRQWKLGSADGKTPALNVVLGGLSLASVFTTPPTPVSSDPQDILDYQLQFDMDRDAGKIYASSAVFQRAAWDDVSARSTDVSQFISLGGKMIVPHGVSDPVFSVEDTLAWYRELQGRWGGKVERSIRVFPVPGMNHCGGGPATDRYDAFAALQSWVESGKAPDQIMATAGPGTPWPGRTRPLCPYPKMAHYRGRGDVERATSFVCR